MLDVIDFNPAKNWKKSLQIFQENFHDSKLVSVNSRIDPVIDWIEFSVWDFSLQETFMKKKLECYDKYYYLIIKKIITVYLTKFLFFNIFIIMITWIYNQRSEF